ncbi:MAG: citrate/2-methylcitrate synthase [Ilumatobacter sp.]|jgi:citrate synthase|uniref:citrate/2-methylcitrate synthase n=1 Tax=Ilumatobacter sp. TaxID=1967498 RepID=UPI00391987AE
MSTLIRSTEAAEILGISKPTLYAYVSRGRLGRTTAADGRTSLFALEEVERLSAKRRRALPGPRPTIDVQIRSDVTTMHETHLEFRGIDVTELIGRHHFEDIAELLWTAELASGSSWPPAATDDLDAIARLATIDATPIGRLAIAAHVLDAVHTDDPPTAARRLLLVTPALLGSRRRTGGYAHRLAAAWRARPSSELVTAVDTALALLADHELATSTLAVRVAASTRTTPYAAFASGLASIEGTLHGSASAMTHRFLDRCAAHGPAAAIAELRSSRQRVPGFGHQVYRGIDPRFAPLMNAVRSLDPEAVTLVDSLIGEVGRTLPHLPNVDLALGALTWAAGLDADTPLFAVARIAGWAAHYGEELDEAPLRFRGVTRPR